MARCILHIGMHKTGSTSIQRSLSGFSDSQFLYYEDRKGGNQTRAMFSLLAMSDEGKRGRGVRKPRESEATRAGQEVLRRLDDSIPLLEGRQLLMSAEGLWLLSADKLGELGRILAARFDAVSIGGYVRAPAPFISSFFQQRVKGGSRRSGGVNVEREYPNYRRAFGKFDDVFGRENVHLWKFDPASFPGGCVVRDFNNQLGIDFPAQRIVRVNEALSRAAVGLLYTYWKLGKDLGCWPMARLEKHQLIRQLMGLGNTKFRFSPDVIKPVLEKNRADIEWMEARLGQSLDENLGEHQPGDVRGEADLLEPDPSAVRALLALLGGAAPRGVRGETPEEVASLVHAVREKHGSDLGGGAKKRPAAPPLATDEASWMDIEELITQIRKANPKRLDGIDDNAATELVRHVFRHINDALAGMDEGVVRYAGLGRFRLRKVKKEIEGRKINRTQIIFRALPENSKDEDED